MPTTSAQDPRDQQPAVTPSVHAVLAACAAARTVSTPPSGPDDERRRRPSAGEDRPAPAPDRDAA
jgi:hypothetical protein